MKIWNCTIALKHIKNIKGKLDQPLDITKGCLIPVRNMQQQFKLVSVFRIQKLCNNFKWETLVDECIDVRLRSRGRFVSRYTAYRKLARNLLQHRGQDLYGTRRCMLQILLLFIHLLGGSYYQTTAVYDQSDLSRAAQNGTGICLESESKCSHALSRVCPHQVEKCVRMNFQQCGNLITHYGSVRRQR